MSMEHGEDLQPTRRFSARVEHYAKFRPGYPRDIVSMLSREAGLTTRSVLADVGAGTGILSELFLRNGNVVYGVEPNDEMRSAAERLLSAYASFRSIAAPAESTTLPDQSVDGVTVAQAFHWFDQPAAIREFRRITRPGGFCALIWNARKSDATPFMSEYERIVRQFGSAFARSGREVESSERLASLFGPDLQLRQFANAQSLDWDGLRGRLLSASYMPLPGEHGFEPMMAALRAAFDQYQHGGTISLEYDTRVYFRRWQ